MNTLMLKSLGSVRNKGCIKLIKSHNKGFYNATKGFYFK